MVQNKEACFLWPTVYSTHYEKLVHELQQCKHVLTNWYLTCNLYDKN